MRADDGVHGKNPAWGGRGVQIAVANGKPGNGAPPERVKEMDVLDKHVAVSAKNKIEQVQAESEFTVAGEFEQP